MGKMICELHAMHIEYENSLPKKAGTPQVMMIKGGKIHKSKKKSLKAKGKGKDNGKGNDKQVYIPKPKNPKPSAKKHPAKDDAYSHCKENNVHYFNAIPSNGIYEIDMHDLVPNVNSIYNVNTKRATRNLDSTYLWHCHLTHISKMTRKSFPHRPLRASCLLGIIQTDVFKNEVENQLGKIIKGLQLDRGGEYISQEFKDYLKACGIFQQLTPPHTPQHNGVSERRMVDKTPYELWYGKVPNLSYLKVRGCEALVKRDTPEKLQQRFVKCIFIGYPKETMGYYFYFPPKNKIVVARYAEFFEKNLITQEVSGRAVDLEKIQYEDTSPSEITSEIPIEVEGFKPPQEEVIQIPSYKAAMLDSKSNKWINAMNAEIQSMIDNMVWVLIDLPPNCKIVGSKWIFKKNTDMDGIVHTYKARLLEKRYTQLYGVDYKETFLPVADIRAIRILISIAEFYDYEI
uniref:Retrotransposon protein, putative, Ty1-copia subclass n=1 Tax=Tanacetum cinerariifolium TaxID=118510 RepID=A0A699JCI1_TANCI|nr:retrotransposon protein, putative, Ty1-copia subclass [Tanacetum cinerariifolium]